MTRTQPMEIDPPSASSNQDSPEWAATMTDTSMATQIMARESDDPRLAGAQEIGRLVGPNHRELFVSCDAAEALRQQFTHLESSHIALHDVGGNSSRQLLRQLATLGGTPVQQLVVRQQGYGTTLASLEYCSYSLPDGRKVQVYSSDTQTTPSAKQAITRVLLELSHTSIVLLSDLPGQGSANGLRTAMHMVHAASWTCPNLLILPLGSAAAAAATAQSSQVVQRHGMLVRAAPQPSRPADAWSYILGFWQKNLNRGRLAAPASSGPQIVPLTLNLPADPPPPVVAASVAPPWPAPRASSPVSPEPTSASTAQVSADLNSYVSLVSQMTGLLSCCVFDINQGAALAYTGRGPSSIEMARQGSAMLRALQMARLGLNLSEAAQEVLISSDRHHQVVRPIPGQPDIALHCLLDRHKTNQSLVRFQLQRLDAWLKQQG
jgi:hypothetical protein